MMYLGNQAVGINNEKFSYPLRYIHTARTLYNNETLPDVFIADFIGNTNIESLESAFNNTKCEYAIIIRGLKPSSQTFIFSSVFGKTSARWEKQYVSEVPTHEAQIVCIGLSIPWKRDGTPEGF